MNTILIAALLIVGLNTQEVLNHELVKEEDPSEESLEEMVKNSKVMEIDSFDELMQVSGQVGTEGTVILICGKDTKMENNCENITLAFKQFQAVFPEFKQEFIYYDLNKADFRITGYFDIERIPHIMFIKDRRIYTYRYKAFSLNHLASFLKFFNDNPDAMWRHFPTQLRSKVDYFVEGLYRLQDRIYLISNGMTWAIYSVYMVFICLFFMLLYGILVFCRDAITGRLYAHLDPDIEPVQPTEAGGSASDQAKPKPSHQEPSMDKLKVKNY